MRITTRSFDITRNLDFSLRECGEDLYVQLTRLADFMRSPLDGELIEDTLYNGPYSIIANQGAVEFMMSCWCIDWIVWPAFEKSVYRKIKVGCFGGEEANSISIYMYAEIPSDEIRLIDALEEQVGVLKIKNFDKIWDRTPAVRQKCFNFGE